MTQTEFVGKFVNGRLLKVSSTGLVSSIAIWGTHHYLPDHSWMKNYLNRAVRTSTV